MNINRAEKCILHLDRPKTFTRLKGAHAEYPHDF